LRQLPQVRALADVPVRLTNEIERLMGNIDELEAKLGS